MLKRLSKNYKIIGLTTLLIIFILLLYVMRDGEVVRMIMVFAALYLVVSKILVHLSAKQMDVFLKRAEDPEDQSRHYVYITVENRGRLPILNCRLQIEVKNLITDNTDAGAWTVDIGPRKKKEIQFIIKDTFCGGIRIILKDAVLSDLTGLIRKRTTLSGEEYVYSMPLLSQLDLSKDEISKYDMESYKYSPIKKGNDSSETFGINVYQPGDSIKSIHWKLSGKMDDIIIRELGLPIDHKLMVIVDKATNGADDFTGEHRSDATQFAASLSYTLVKMSIPHHIGWFNMRKNEFEVFRVNDENDIWTYMPALLTSPYDEELKPAADQFIEADIEKNYSGIALVSNDEIEIERLMDYGEVNIYRPENFK
ncbi:MAG: DUF58 domain-containing protein [Emergencia sp.]